MATYGLISSKYLAVIYQSPTARRNVRARWEVKGRNRQGEMKRSWSLEQGLWSTTAGKKKTIVCCGGEERSSYSTYCPRSLSLYYVTFLFQKCKRVNESNYSDFKQMALLRCSLRIFILSIIFIQKQSKWNSTSSAKWSNFFWGNLNECFSSPMLPFISFHF